MWRMRVDCHGLKKLLFGISLLPAFTQVPQGPACQPSIPTHTVKHKFCTNVVDEMWMP